MENHHFIAGKTHYKWPLAMLNYQRVCWMAHPNPSARFPCRVSTCNFVKSGWSLGWTTSATGNPGTTNKTWFLEVSNFWVTHCDYTLHIITLTVWIYTVRFDNLSIVILKNWTTYRLWQGGQARLDTSNSKLCSVPPVCLERNGNLATWRVACVQTIYPIILPYLP